MESKSLVPVAPLAKHGGRLFSGASGDYDDLGHTLGCTDMGGAFSVAFTARWDCLRSSSRVIDFGNGPKCGNISVGNKGGTGTFVFIIWKGNAEYCLQAEDVIKERQTNRYLCVVTEDGLMQAYQDATLIGECQGSAPGHFYRRQLYIGKSHWEHDGLFQGVIDDIRIWSVAVNWDGTKVGIPQLPGKSLAVESIARKSRTSGDTALTKESLELKADWKGQSVELREEGFWCVACGSGPMTGSLVVERHIATAKHQRRLQEMNGAIGGGAGVVGKRHDSAFELRPGLVEQGIEQRSDGLWCLACGSGPMNAHQVEQHIGAPKHIHRLQERNLQATGLSQEFVSQGIAQSDTAGEFKCTLCSAGPFKTLQVAKAHIGSKKHQQRAIALKGKELGSDPFEYDRWNLPDYVQEEEVGHLRCTLCDVAAKAFIPMLMHLGGNQHAKKCRSGGHPELVYLKERRRLQLQATGEPVVRKGYSAPVEGTEQTNINEQEADARDAAEVAESQELADSAVFKWLDVPGIEDHEVDGMNSAGYPAAKESKIESSLASEWLAAPRGIHPADNDVGLEAVNAAKQREWIPTAAIAVSSSTADAKSCPPAQPGASQQRRNSFTISDEWRAQGIECREDALWCTLCNQGPMNAQVVVEKHMQSQKHARKMEERRLLAGSIPDGGAVPEAYAAQGIVVGSYVGEFKCILCGAGPFNAITTVDAHTRSKKHQQRILNPQFESELPEGIVLVSEAAAAGPVGTVGVCQASASSGASTSYRCSICNAGPFTSVTVLQSHIDSKKHQQRIQLPTLDKDRWNLPDYVTEDDANWLLLCTLCNSGANAVLVMCMHLGGDKHAKKCRSHGYEEIVFSKEQERLLVASTKQPVVRTGYGEQPTIAAVEEQNGKKLSSVHHDAGTNGNDATLDIAAVAGAIATAEANGGANQQLPPGWQAIWSEEAHTHYYADAEEQTVQWEPPPSHNQRDWVRQVDEQGHAYWGSPSLKISFYEHGDPFWRRLVDHDGRTYWSHRDLGIRFFEPLVAIPNGSSR